MRLLGLFVLTFIFVDHCSCYKGSSIKPRGPGNRGFYSTSRPRNRNEKPSRTQNLRIAAEVFQTLGNTTQQSFASTFLSIRQKKLLSALRGVSIVGRYIAKLFGQNPESLDADSIEFHHQITTNMDKMTSKVHLRTNFFFNSIENSTYDEKMKKINEELKGGKNDSATIDFMSTLLKFNSVVALPLNKTSDSMVKYLWVRYFDNRDAFTKDYVQASMEQMISTTMQLIPQLLDYKRNASGNDDITFEELRSNITRYFFQEFIIQYFQVGVGSVRSPYSEEIKVQDASFRIRHQHITKIMKEKSYHPSNVTSLNSSFPGTISKDIVRPLIDIILEKWGQNMSNCLIAENIKDKLEKQYHKDKFYTIVFNTTNTTNQYAIHGFTQRTLVDHYHGKTVLILKATEKAIQNKKDHYDFDTARILTQLTFDARDVNTALTYAKNENRGYQMGVFSDDLGACYCPVNSTFAHEFRKTANQKPFSIVIVF